MNSLGMLNNGLRLGLLSRIQGLHNLPRLSVRPGQRPQLRTFTASINQTDAALSVTKHLLLKEEYQNTNVVFSPLLLHSALSVLTAGSDGPTRDQLLTFLGAESIDHVNSFASKLATVVLRHAAPDGGPLLRFANGVWVEQSVSLQPSFKELLTRDYMATLAFVDFKNKADEVVNEVNLWAEEKTNGLIKNILSSGSADSLTRLILTNALYFKGAWNQKFCTSMTKDRDFHLLNDTSVKVPFMTSYKDQFIGVFDGFKVLRLSYKKNNEVFNSFEDFLLYKQGNDKLPSKQDNDERRFSMYIFLPDANDGMSTLVEQMASESGFLERHLPRQKVKVGDFSIPKFKIFYGLDMSNVVKEMGLVLPFSKDYADFTKIVKPVEPMEPLFVSNIIQKSYIEVNEEGTEAAAATGIFGSGAGLRDYPKMIDFVADHPFDWNNILYWEGASSSS